MDPWYKVVTPREEVREGRSFNPDEFAIDLAQVVNGTAPRDYRDPEQFFSRTFFTQALTEHTGTVLRRLSGRTESTAPVLSLVTQFGGGKTHTLTALYHLAKSGQRAGDLNGVQDVLKTSGVTVPDRVRVATFVGSAWDPAEGKETPWIDVIRQISGAKESAYPGSQLQELGPRDRNPRQCLQGSGRSRPDPLRRGPQLHQPVPRHGGPVLFLPAEPHGLRRGHHPRRGGGQPAPEPG